MRVLVTGGCGFIGSHLVERLVTDGHHVVVLDNLSSGKRSNIDASVTFVEGDVADADLVGTLLTKHSVKAVFHLAAVASVELCTRDWLNAHRTNLTGTVTIFDRVAHYSRETGRTIPVIYASSAAIYGDNQNLPLAETELPAPLSAYGLDKLSCERYGEIAWNFHGVPNVGLRFFNVFGPRQDAASPYSGVISKFMANAVAGKPLTFFGDGEQTRDFIYVGDIIELLLSSWKAAHSHHVFNGCTGARTSLKQLAASIDRVTGKISPTSHAEAREGDIRHSLGSPTKASSDLNFNAKTSLDDGLLALYRSEAPHAA